MSYEQHNIGRVRGFVEVGTFGADTSASAGSFTDIPFIEGTVQITLTEASLDPGQLVQHIDDAREHVRGPRTAVLTGQLNITPGTVGTNGVASAPQVGLGMILKAWLGGETASEGSVAASGSTATVINVSAGDGVQFGSGGGNEGGKIMGWSNGSFIEWRPVKSRSTDAVTLQYGFSGSPALNDPLYSKTVYYPTAQPANRLAMIVEGLESDDRWLLTGGAMETSATVAIDLTGAQLPRLTVSITFVDWYSSTETASSLTGALGAATFANYNPVVGESGMFETWTNGTATYSAANRLPVSALSFEPRFAFVKQTAPNGVNTVKEWTKARQPNGPLMGQFTLPYEATTWFAHQSSKTDIGLMYALGVDAAANSVIMNAPTVQVIDVQRMGDASNTAAQTVKWKGRRDGDVGSATGDLAKAPMRWYL
jgi:hypothetical protein